MTDDKTKQTERATPARRADQAATDRKAADQAATDTATERTATTARRANQDGETATERKAAERRAKEEVEAGVPQIDASPAPAIEATAVRAGVQADEDKNLPNADTVSKQVEKKAK